MTAAQRSDKEAMASSYRDACVVLRLEFEPPCTPAEIEDYAAMVQEAVDAHAEGIAIDAAVRCEYDPMTVEIIFTVQARSVSEVHQRVALVVAAIEPALPFEFETETATRMGRHAEPALA